MKCNVGSLGAGEVGVVLDVTDDACVLGATGGGRFAIEVIKTAAQRIGTTAITDCQT